MASEESNGAEFQERTGLKRKLTGPPRLLLGKSRSPGQDERKSRRRRRHNDGAPVDMTTVEQVDSLASPESPACPTTELGGGTCTDLQQDYLEAPSNLEQSTKKRRRRREAGATIRRIFSCVWRRKELGMKAVEDADENQEALGRSRDKELLTRSSDSLRMKREQKLREKIGASKFKMGMWRIFKKRPFKGKRGEHGAGRRHETVSELSAETRGDQRTEPPAVEEQQNESSGTDEDMTRIHEGDRLESRAPRNSSWNNKGMETISLNIDMNVDLKNVFAHPNHHHPSVSHSPCPPDGQEPKTPISEATLTVTVESNSDPKYPRTSPEDPVTEDVDVDVSVENVNVFKGRPDITIEDVHTSDEEIDELFVDVAPQYVTLSPLTALNGSCYSLKTSESRFSEIILAQTALSLVRAAIRGAVAQLSAEQQSRQMDQDHV